MVFLWFGFFFSAMATLVHVYIFVMESMTWTSKRTREAFGLSNNEAQATKSMAFNQGFYNLFLAIGTAVGLGLTGAGLVEAGMALVLAGAGSMAAAGLVLLCSDRTKTAAALKQLAAPLVAVVFLGIGLV